MLKKIHIENFKSLKNVDVPCAGLNLLMGINGAGKSSFVQVLRLLDIAADHIEALLQKICAEDFGGGVEFKDIQYSYGTQSPTISVSFGDDKGGHYELERVLDDDDVDERPGIIDLHHPEYIKTLTAYLDMWELEARRDNGIDVSQEEIRNAQENGERASAEVQERILLDEHAAVDVYKRLWHGARFVDSFRQKPVDIREGGTYNRIPFIFFDDSHDSRDIRKFASEGQNTIEFLYKISQTVEGSHLIEDVNKCLDWVSPGARLDIEEKRVGTHEYYVTTFDYGVNGDRRLFKPQNVGFGLNDILPVLVTLLTAKKGSIIVIENPEAHLHPRGQAEIGKLIAETASRGVQVFIETHSDHVINGIRVAVKKGVLKPSDVNIAFFERKEHDVVDDEGKESREIFTTVRDIKVDENGSLSEYPEDFMDEWNNQLMRLL